MTERHHGSVGVIRSFRLTGEGRLLAVTTAGADPATPASAAGYVWTDGDNHAGCRRPGHTGPVPGQDCTCGFYGFASDGDLRRSLTPGAHDLAAVVAVSGRVVPARCGLRAQHARIEALWLSSRVEAELARRIAARYPSVAVFRDRSAMLGEFPLTWLPGYRLRRGPSGLLLSSQLLLAAVWIVATAASSARSSPVPPGAGAVAPLGAAAAAGLVVWLRRSSRYWPGSVALPAVLLAAGFVLSGLAGVAVAGAAVLGNLTGLAAELCLFAVTHLPLGRQLPGLDPQQPATHPLRSRADPRSAGVRLLALFAADLMIASAAGPDPAGLRPVLLLAGAVLMAALTTVFTRRETYQHQLGLWMVSAGLLLGQAGGALTSRTTATAGHAIGTAAMLLIFIGIVLYWLEPTLGRRSSR